MPRRIFMIFSLAVSVAVSFFISGPAHPAQPPAIQATVLRVHDGDTIVVRLDGRTEKVRLIGIDTPEVDYSDKMRRDLRRDRRHTLKELLRLGRQARELTARLAPPGSKVSLELDLAQRDKYGRLLAYVWVSVPEKGRRGQPGRVMVNAALIEAGLARLMTIPPNVRHADHLYGLQRKARTEKRGIWADKPSNALK